jgi:SOS response regulatory protein OraA/RecX
MATSKENQPAQGLIAAFEKRSPANPALTSSDKTYLRGLRRKGYTQEEIKTIASDAGFAVPDDLFETGKRQKQS